MKEKYIQEKRCMGWNNRHSVTTSSGNNQLHGFFREYFDKKPKRISSSFRIRYCNSVNELPGIVDVHSKNYAKVKEFSKKVEPEKPYSDIQKVLLETRMPLKKGQSRAYPTAKKHFQLVSGWQNDFINMRSHGNSQLHRDKREFFDKPIKYSPGMNTNKTVTLKPMEVYHQITPVRSIQQSIDLIRALKTEEKEEKEKRLPKDGVARSVSSITDNISQIPNLRSSAPYISRKWSKKPLSKQISQFDSNKSLISGGSPSNLSRGASGINQDFRMTDSQWVQNRAINLPQMSM